ncbi:hypothetical protein FSP39_007152 [Pinctada imbricata]|uniref:Tubulin-specific chaperone E n=1 Tax=Pinctada imbricata TaxID=66713 RepID=A0AA88XYT4_PINIB|nr:hypothetical protein FSP39_007152 [Pinctada imbricata]
MNKSSRSLSRRYAYTKDVRLPFDCRWAHVEDNRPSLKGLCVHVRHAIQCTELLRADGSLINVNDRVSCDGYIGTVKFIGNLNQEKTKGIWLGVDWDNEERGKHDGSLNGVQYFTTSTPKSGSFVRPKKVNGGVSCYMAIKDRYGKQEEENAGVIADELYVVDSKKKKTIVEMVGAEFINLKQSNLNYLQEVVLKEMLVYGVGIHGNDLMNHTRNIQELDISKNLLSSWENVANIAKCLPNLENLNVRYMYNILK